MLFGLTAHPAVGEAADVGIVDAGGTVVPSEITEMSWRRECARHRSSTPEVQSALLRLIKQYEIDLSMTTEDDSGVFISPGNIEGGLTTIEEKSLGCIYKAGTATDRRDRSMARSGRSTAWSSSWIRPATTSLGDR